MVKTLARPSPERAVGGRKTRGMPLEIAERIRYWMVDRGVNWALLQATMREHGTSVSESTMSRLLNGKTEPKIGTLGAIAEVLQVELRDLMPAGREATAIAAEHVPLSVPTAHWSVGMGIEVDQPGRSLLLSSELLPRNQALVALEIRSNALALADIAAGDVLIVDLGTEVDQGAEVLLVDGETGLERLMWVHHVDDGLVRYSDANGYLLDSIDLIKGTVRLVIRGERRRNGDAGMPQAPAELVPASGWPHSREREREQKPLEVSG